MLGWVKVEQVGRYRWMILDHLPVQKKGDVLQPRGHWGLFGCLILLVHDYCTKSYGNDKNCIIAGHDRYFCFCSDANDTKDSGIVHR